MYIYIYIYKYIYIYIYIYIHLHLRERARDVHGRTVVGPQLVLVDAECGADVFLRRLRVGNILQQQTEDVVCLNV